MQTVNLAFTSGGIISMLIGTVLPIVVGFVTKESWNPGLKSAILAGLAAVSGVLAQWLTAINDNDHFAWQAAVLSAFATWAVAEATYFKWWKPSGVSDIVQAAGPISDTPSITTLTTPATPDPTPGAQVVDMPVDTGVALATPPPDGGKWKGPEHLAR